MHISHGGDIILSDITIFTIPAYAIPKVMFKLQNCFPLGKLQMRADFLFGLLRNMDTYHNSDRPTRREHRPKSSSYSAS